MCERALAVGVCARTGVCAFGTPEARQYVRHPMGAGGVAELALVCVERETRFIVRGTERGAKPSRLAESSALSRPWRAGRRCEALERPALRLARRLRVRFSGAVRCGRVRNEMWAWIGWTATTARRSCRHLSARQSSGFAIRSSACEISMAVEPTQPSRVHGAEYLDVSRAPFTRDALWCAS